MQNQLRERMHGIINHLAEEDLSEMYGLMSELYGDMTMLKAIQAAKRSLTPGASLTQEEALQALSFNTPLGRLSEF